MTAIKRINKVKLNFTPDETMSYSNLGYCLLGEVVKQATQQDYKGYINRQYDLTNAGIRFIGNHRLDDEVFYNYVQSGLTGFTDIYTAFDYEALASVAGLSGNAVALANQVKQMVTKPEPNILSQTDDDCDLTKLRDCYGYAMFPYRAKNNALKVYYRDGVLLGLSTLVVVSEKGEIVTLLSNGRPRNGQSEADQVKKIIYKSLNSSL